MEQAPEQQHAFAQLSSQVARSTRRLMRLEANVTEAEVNVKRSSLDQDDSYTALGREFSLVGDELERLRESIVSFTKMSGKVMLHFRELVKNNQFVEVERRLDEWPLESFMTRKEFLRLLEQKFTKRL